MMNFGAMKPIILALMLTVLQETFSAPVNGVDDEAGQRAWLTRFGYMSSDTSSWLGSSQQSAFAEGVRHFQRFLGLRETGVVNDAMKTYMKMPRCGMTDYSSSASIGRYVLQGSNWTAGSTLTYRINRYSLRLLPSLQEEIFKIAFDFWASVANIQFRRVVHSFIPVAIDINFFRGDHGDNYAFDGPGNTVAHAFFPQFGGNKHYDEDENWTHGTTQGINLLETAVHEIGHSLGLSHSQERAAVMWPFVRAFDPNFALGQDDIRGIQAIYGPSPTVTPPATTRAQTTTGCEADVVFAVDASRDIRIGYWFLVRLFLRRLATDIVGRSTTTRIGMSRFSDRGDVIIHLSEFRNLQNFINVIDHMAYIGRETNTMEGLERAQQIFSQGQRSGVNRILILITDGKPTLNIGQEVPVAQNIRNSGIRIIALGVTNDIDTNTLVAITGDPNLVLLSSVDFINWTSIIGNLLNVVCQGNSFPTQRPTPFPTPRPTPFPTFRPTAFPTRFPPATSPGQIGALRLTGNRSSENQGRVEIYYDNQWNTICDDYWDNKDAAVVCKQLRYSYGQARRVAHFGRGTGNIAMDDVNCTGIETLLLNCPFRGWNRHNCAHTEDAGVICSNTPIIGHLRLVGGASFNQGKIEIYHQNKWNAICDDDWDDIDATVACKQLGYAFGVAKHEGYYGTDSIAMDDVNCTGAETRLMDCPFSGWNKHNCNRNEDAGVVCSYWRLTGMLRLRGGTFGQGRLEIYYGSQWNTICDDNWDNTDATVACRQLGFRSGEAKLNGTYGVGSGGIAMDEVTCSGKEHRLTDCSFNGWNKHDCNHSEDAGVVCYMKFCNSSPCKNGGTCTENQFQYQCACQKAYSGRNCQTAN